MKKSLTGNKQKYIRGFKYLIFGGVLSITIGVYAAINYSEYFPNESSIVQSQPNGWTTPINSASKEVVTPEGCKKITSSQGQMMFVPTRTSVEWNSFKAGLPSGVTISECYTYSWNTGGWGICTGETGTWNTGGWGICSASCGGGYQTRAASCSRGNNGTQSRTVSCQRNDGMIVTDSFCSGVKPGINQNCTQGTDTVCGNVVVNQVCNMQSCCGQSINSCTTGTVSNTYDEYGTPRCYISYYWNCTPSNGSIESCSYQFYSANACD